MPIEFPDDFTAFDLKRDAIYGGETTKLFGQSFNDQHQLE